MRLSRARSFVRRSRRPPIGGAGVWVLALGLGGCYEIPPEVPESYVDGGGEPGWPPLAVYDTDRFHVANRIFQRLFVLGCGDVSGDVPWPDRRPLERADRAELLALLDRLDDIDAGDGSGVGAPRGVAAGASPTRPEPAPPPVDHPLGPRGRLLLVRDLEFLAGRWRTSSRSADRELASRVERSLRALRSATDLPRSLPAPPRDAVSKLPETGLGDHPRPVGNGLAAWKLERRTDEGVASIFHFRRSSWIIDEEPWREVGRLDRIAVVDEDSGTSTIRFGAVRELCGGCHALDSNPAPEGDTDHAN